MFCETGFIGLVLGTVFLWSIIWSCLKASKTLHNNVFGAVAWIIPFGLFWPIATSADFLGSGIIYLCGALFHWHWQGLIFCLKMTKIISSDKIGEF